MLSTAPHLLVLTARAHRVLTADVLKALGLASGEELVLAELWREDGLTPTDLARRLELRRPTVTTVLHTMERRGLVERRPDERDGRVVRVHHTERAGALRPALEGVWRAAEGELFRGLSRKDIAALRALLKRAIEARGSVG